ncbi:MAG: hypothetical protein AB1551_05445 [Actinomycetota bacterium]
MAEAKAGSPRAAATPRAGRAIPRAGRGTRRRAAATEVPPQEERPLGAEKSSQVCPVAFCPVGLALTAVRKAGPDVMEHLLAAAREFLLAAKAVMDTRAGDLDERAEPAQLERIEIK